MPKIAANLSLLFTELPFLERFQAAAQTGGFQAVEFQYPYDYDLDDLKAAVEQAGLPVALINAPPGENFGLAALETPNFTESIELALHYATALGAPKLHVMAGITPATPEAATTFIRNIRAAAELAAAQGVLVVVEPINQRTVPGYFLHDLDQALELIRGIPNVAILFDIFHIQQIHGDLSHRLRTVHTAGLLGHVQVASVPERQEPGSGEVNDAHVFALLDELSYPGVIGAEYRPAGATEEGLSWLGTL